MSIGTRPTLSFGEPVLVPRPFVNAPPARPRTYDVAHEGKRFLGLRDAADTKGAGNLTAIQVVLNWFEELKVRAPLR